MLDIRRRTGYLLLAVTVGHVLLISAQVSTASGVPVLEKVTFGALSEMQRAASGVATSITGMWRGYFALRGTHEENEALKTELSELRVRLQEERAVAERSRQLEALLDLRGVVALPTAAANVISADPTPWFRTITIDKGAEDGLTTDMAVIAPGGVVGRIVGELAPRAARVQLLIDRNAAAGALIARSRATGLVTGGGGDIPLEMQYVSSVADIQVGDAVVTSGIDGIYPKGFVIGHVAVAETGTTGTRVIRVQPAVDFTALEHVLVLTIPRVTLPAPEGTE